MHPTSPYKAGNIDPLQYGNHTRWMNWGFPNAVWTNSLYKGVTIEIVIAGEEIKKGQFIYLHYGTHYWKTPVFTPFFIFGKKQLEDFFKQGLAKLLQQANNENEFKKQFINQRLEFPVCTPCTIIYLHYKNIVNVKEWLAVIKDGNVHPMFSNWNLVAHQRNTYSIIIDGYENIINLEKKLNDPALNEYIGKWFINQIGVISFEEIAKILKNCLEDKYKFTLGNAYLILEDLKKSLKS